ncbi:MAG: hypothetical protein JXB10_01525 [Pirellulales bacterium]|nr:hypothetical protein [Pirellulales bacterium]
MKSRTLTRTGFLLLATALGGSAPAAPSGESVWQTAQERCETYADCGNSAFRLLHGWIERKQDPQTHLFSRGSVWNYQNEAADHYSSLVLIAHYLEPVLNEGDGKLRATLLDSIRLCATKSGIPCTYDLRTMTPGKVDVGAVCEWLRDGLLRITEVIGTDNDWFREFVRLTDAVLAEGRRRGGIHTIVHGTEDEGNLIQILVRLSAMSGRTEYLDDAEVLADCYLLDDPLKKIKKFNFVDHGCELVPGLSELFVMESKLKRPKVNTYRKNLQRLLDRLLEVGRHPKSGLWYTHANLEGPQPKNQGKPQKLKRPGRFGAKFSPDVPHCWGYVLFALENFDRATGGNRYREAVEKPMRYLTENRSRFDELRNVEWPWNFAPGCFGDTYESMIILWKRYPDVPDVAPWLDWTTKVGGFRRKASSHFGPGVGGHTDGCIGRNLCAHMMLQSQGVRAVPYQEGLGCGAVRTDGVLRLVVQSKDAWSGRLCFDGPRNEYPLATIDWARINEIPQWYVVRKEKEYQLTLDDEPPTVVSGADLIDGRKISIKPGQSRKILLQEKQ